MGAIGHAVRVRRPPKLPVVLTAREVDAIPTHLSGQYRLMAQLLYGSGLRLLECLRLRLKDVDLARLEITVRESKAGKDRRTMVPVSVVPLLREHLEGVKRKHEIELAVSRGEVWLPGALEKKMPKAARAWAWQWVFPASRSSIDPRTGAERRHQ